MADLPIACALTPETVATRKAALLPGLAHRAELREETTDGYRLRFAASTDTLQAILTTVDAERQCCRFLRFDLALEPDNGPMWLTMSGPSGTRAFLSALLDA